MTWPKTILQPETERGLTSEFGMGSGGTRALWPANPRVHVDFLLISLSLQRGKSCSNAHAKGSAEPATIHIFELCDVILRVERGRSLGRYDDGLQKVVTGLRTSKGMKRFWSCQKKPVGAALRALLWVKVGGSNPPGPTTLFQVKPALWRAL